MKYLSIILFLLFFTTFVSGQQKEVIDRTSTDADLDNSRTYAMGSNGYQDQDQVWVTTNSLLNNMVKNSIVYEFDTYGLEMDSQNPDMVVNYIIYDKAYDEIIGFRPPYQIENENAQDENILNKMKDGSLMISVIDTESNKAVWEGFVLDGLNPDDDLRAQQQDIRQAISSAIASYMAKVNFKDVHNNRFDVATGAN